MENLNSYFEQIAVAHDAKAVDEAAKVSQEVQEAYLDDAIDRPLKMVAYDNIL